MPAAGENVVELVGTLVVVQLGVLNVDVMDLGGCSVLLLDQAADLAARFHPGLDFRHVSCTDRWLR